jgi:hypothetical protein
MAEEEEPGILSHYVRGIRTSTRHNAAAYGYSVTATASFGALARIEGSPDLLDMFLYLVGAGLAFAIVNTVATRGFRERLPEEPAVVVLLGTAFSFASVTASLGTCVGIAYALRGWAGWLAATLAFTTVYILLVGLELALAANLHHLGGIEGERRRRDEEREEERTG